jgi:BMFP domain-containing protein YqiC
LKSKLIRNNQCKALTLALFLVAGVNGFTQKAIAVPLEEQKLYSDETKTPVEKESMTNLSFSSVFTDNSSDDSMAQVTSVSQLKDVQPTDWAFQALQSLVERYGCIAGYPNETYRGNRALTRYEFAAGVNACLDRVNELIATATADLVKREDLATLQKLQEEFGAELATLRGRVDNLEARTAELEGKQFSTTTTLRGTTVFGVQGRTRNRADVNPRDGKKDSNDPGTNANVINLTQLYLTTQFNPRSFLVTGLFASNGSSKPNFSNDAVLGYELPTGNQQVINELHYHHLITNKLAMMVGTASVDMWNAFRGPNRIERAGTGPLSFFAQRNPILNIGFGQAGIAFDWQFAKRASLQALYGSLNAESPGKNSGLFNGKTTAGAQLLVTPTDNFDVSLYYVNSYSPDGCISFVAGDNCLTAVNNNTNQRSPIQTNAVGATINWQLSPKFALGAWGGYTKSNIPGRSGNVETTNWMVFLNFPDLLKKGNVGGIYIGQPPKISNSTLPIGDNVPDIINTGLGRAGGQPGSTLHLEAFYRYQLTDNVSITPGIIHIMEPGHTPNSDPITIGILRTTFLF